MAKAYRESVAIYSPMQVHFAKTAPNNKTHTH